MTETKSRVSGSLKPEGDFGMNNNKNNILESHRLWLENKNSEQPNLRGANLCEADLRGADLCEANLREADLRWSDLREADLREADLRGADLSVANLRGANLCEANLREANLRWSDLREANLYRADLRGANTDFYFTYNSIYPIICVNDHVQIGCLSKDYEYFANMASDQARELDGTIGVDFYKNHLPKILRAYKELKK